MMTSLEEHKKYANKGAIIIYKLQEVYSNDWCSPVCTYFRNKTSIDELYRYVYGDEYDPDDYRKEQLSLLLEGDIIYHDSQQYMLRKVLVINN